MIIKKAVVGQHIMKNDVLLGLITEKIDHVRFITYALKGNLQHVQFNESNYYRVDIVGYARAGNISISKAYAELEDIVQHYKDTSIRLDIGNGQILVTSLVFQFILDKDKQEISICWNKKLIPYISGEQLPGTFSYYHICMSNINSAKHYALYEVMQRQAYKKQFILTVEEIRATCNLTEGMYAKFNELNRHFIIPTVKDIESNLNCTINITQRRDKQRKIISILFEVV